MAKQFQNTPIGSAELLEFLNTSSDFAFELRCMERLLQLGFHCQHGGSYIDRVTNKARQFDIRAQKENGGVRIRCAVECKNISAWFPLLIMCVPRAADESFHELVFSYHPDMMGKRQRSPFDIADPFRKNCGTVRHPASDYAIGGPVGKSSAQVGKSQDNSIVASDAEAFEKWSQALASAHDLADQAAEDGERHKQPFVSLILPILVVPDGALWKVDYSANGTRIGDPLKADRCSFFVGRNYYAGDRMRGTSLTISHLEFVTLSGLGDLTKNILNWGNSWFPSLEMLVELATEKLTEEEQ
jgi:hypothetical protein